MLSNDYIIGGDSDSLGEAVPYGCFWCGGCYGCEGCVGCKASGGKVQ
ncbi:MAG: hypothetical protein K2N34_02515 [Lachnospiraceae bacterium]|nr:hypothetical protein [Lachnospiraceae bacterium]